MPPTPVQTVIHTAKHYIVGLLASCWDAGITSVQLLGGVAVVSAAAPTTLSQLDLKHMIAVFGASAFWQAIAYFKEHKLEELVEAVETQEMKTTLVAAPTPVATATPTA